MDEVGPRSLADSVIAQMAAQRDLLREMDDRFASISAHVDSPDESVSVEVDGLGAITGLWLSPQALELEHDAVAKLIVDTASSAAQLVLDRQDVLVKELNERMHAVREMPLTQWDGTKIQAP
jgi:DNA-binding protein YbaB